MKNSMKERINIRLGEEDGTNLGWFKSSSPAQQRKYLLGLKDMFASKYFGEVSDKVNGLKKLTGYEFHDIGKKSKEDVMFCLGASFRNLDTLGLLGDLKDNPNKINELKQEDKSSFIKTLAVTKLTDEKLYSAILNSYDKQISDKQSLGFLFSETNKVKLDKSVEQELKNMKLKLYAKLFPKEKKKDIGNNKYIVPSGKQMQEKDYKPCEWASTAMKNLKLKNEDNTMGYSLTENQKNRYEEAIDFSFEKFFKKDFKAQLRQNMTKEKKLAELKEMMKM